jgi:hypothetical protein
LGTILQKTTRNATGRFALLLTDSNDAKVAPQSKRFDCRTGKVMKLKHKVFLVASFLVGVVSANQFWDGNKLLARMTGDYQDQSHALGYVLGVVDTDGKRKVCAPPNVTAGQLNDIVMHQLQTRPEVRHFPADVIVLGSLARVWPCERKGSSS